MFKWFWTISSLGAPNFSIALWFGRTVAVIRAIFSVPEWPFKGVLSFWSYMMNTKQLPHFTNIVCRAGYHFSLVIPRQWFPFRLFTCCVTAVCTTEMQCITISRNSVHNSDAFTFMLIETSIGEIFHLSRNICSESFRWWPNRNVMGHQELDFFGNRFVSPQFKASKRTVNR